MVYEGKVPFMNFQFPACLNSSFRNNFLNYDRDRVKNIWIHIIKIF